MSEYQYYEFLAVDRSLTKKEIEQVRRFSSRADISAMRFVNEYNWGDFRGDPDEFLARWFELMVYLANWGTQRLMVAVPALDVADALVWRRYESQPGLEIRTRGERLILDFTSELEERGDWPEGEGWMVSLAPVREELLAGDLRPLFLGWLAGVSDDPDAADSSAPPPPVPAGLDALTAAQQTLADFLRVDEDLLAVATRYSPAAHQPDDDLENWIASLPQREKDQMLLAAAIAEPPAHVGTQLLRRYRASRNPGTASTPQTTVGEWLRAARAGREAREAAERERRARECARKAAERAAEREKHLANLAARQDAAWREVDRLIAMKNADAYGLAVTLLADLRELAVRRQSLDAFAERVAAIRDVHRRKINLIDSLRGAGLLSK